MKTALALAALIAFTGAAIAQGLKVQPTSTTSTTANAPSGIEVPGCTYMRYLPGQIDAVQVCNQKSIRAILHDNRYEAADSKGSDSTASK